MKRIILTLVIVILINSLSFGQKCKPKYTDKDDFTEKKIEYWGNTMTSMAVYSYGIQFSPRMYAFKKNGKDKLIFGLAFDSKLKSIDDMKPEGHSWFEKGSKIIIKVDGGFEEFIVEHTAINNASYSSAEITVSATKEQIETLANIAMEKVRIHPFIDNSDDLLQFTIAKGRDKKIKQQLKCFLKL